jgi:hypothetical protein
MLIHLKAGCRLNHQAACLIAGNVAEIVSEAGSRLRSTMAIYTLETGLMRRVLIGEGGLLTNRACSEKSGTDEASMLSD